MKKEEGGWFTVEEIDGDTFAIGEYKHWEEAHAYLLTGRRRAVLIDTGLGVGRIDRVVKSLTDLPISVLTTHVHWDHIGGHGLFEDVAVHEAGREWLKSFPIPLAVVRSNLTRPPCDFPEGFRPSEYRVYQGEAKSVYRDGDRFDLGGRTLTAIHTPGHSPGHCCFYEAERKTLYSGDLIYGGCLDAFYPTTDPLLFWRSIQKIQALAVDRILPGHHALSLSAGIVDRIEAAFAALSAKDKLFRGSGLYDFGEFQIHL
ncbi:MAG: MBL fold metallo-hydrolase [Bacteroides sp.]|nr:MBL fold metallo-hydrolase [Eubacterium sp.]MCM1417406.1 MBL fold metallo-hydrolase [Roseburia sp.]MCM1461585.1 MBL fold metallo-hydrolase [Bacteroides sp.]